jgi:hypothetical protein
MLPVPLCEELASRQAIDRAELTQEAIVYNEGKSWSSFRPCGVGLVVLGRTYYNHGNLKRSCSLASRISIYIPQERMTPN